MEPIFSFYSTVNDLMEDIYNEIKRSYSNISADSMYSYLIQYVLVYKYFSKPVANNRITSMLADFFNEAQFSHDHFSCPNYTGNYCNAELSQGWTASYISSMLTFIWNNTNKTNSNLYTNLYYLGSRVDDIRNFIKQKYNLRKFNIYHHGNNVLS